MVRLGVMGDHLRKGEGLGEGAGKRDADEATRWGVSIRHLGIQLSIPHSLFLHLYILLLLSEFSWGLWGRVYLVYFTINAIFSVVKSSHAIKRSPSFSR